MNFNSDFSKNILIDTHASSWQVSPMKGVERKPLDRIGDEIARATSLVKYAPNSHFSGHIHTGGEEFLVLEGVFQDEHGDYPAGTYIRNPPQSSHTPFSEKGCVILVKLWQFELTDRFQMNINIFDKFDKTPVQTELCCLYENNHEKVAVLRIKADESYSFSKHEGLELFVLEGEGTITPTNELTSMPIRQAFWFRQGVDASIVIEANTEMTIWLKYDHLPSVPQQIKNLSNHTT